MQRKLILDCEYIQNMGLWMDLRLFLCTAARLFRISLVRLLGLHRNVILPKPGDCPGDAEPLVEASPAYHVPHVRGHGNGQSLAHSADGTMHAGRQGKVTKRPR